MKGLAVIGCGNWGKNLVRTYHQLLGERLRYVGDLSNEKLQKISREFPSVKTTSQLDTIFNDPQIDAVAIATTANTHFTLARQALQAGKHVYVEKPMTLKVQEAEALVKIADEAQRHLMVGHILIYHPVVQKLKQLIDSGELGKIYYIYSQRLNLGTVRVDENAMWSFAPHDISVIFYLLGAQLKSIAASGQSFLSKGVEDVVFVNMRFDTGQIANIHLSWLDPHKRRLLTIVGEKKMVVFDDMETQEKLKIYDKGVEFAADYRSYGEYYQLRFGDILIPKVDGREPLYVTCQQFIKCIESNTKPLTSGREGLKVVQALNFAQQSLENGGQPALVV